MGCAKPFSHLARQARHLLEIEFGCDPDLPVSSRPSPVLILLLYIGCIEPLRATLVGLVPTGGPPEFQVRLVSDRGVGGTRIRSLKRRHPAGRSHYRRGATGGVPPWPSAFDTAR